jgi:surface polysaccharide O-acyltransferase-like enzyme
MKIKYLAVIVATLVHYILGGLWYGLFFKNKFIELMAWTPAQLQEMEQKGAGKELAMAFVTSLIIAYVLAHLVQYTRATTAMAGIQTAFWLWLGFIATTNLSTVLFEQRPLGLYLINVSYELVGCAIAGAILAVWRPQEVVAPLAA